MNWSVGAAALASLALLVAAVAVQRATSFNPFATSIRSDGALPRASVTSRADDSTVRVRWRPADLAPAAHAGRLCLNNSPRGRVCAAFVEGERPADSLSRKLRTLGLRVESAS
jgi:hypothetical protein